MKVYKVLGVLWDADVDVLTFDLSKFLRDSLLVEVVTKRHVLRTLSQIFDPLGLFAVVVFILKMMFQEVCAQKIDWDAPLCAECSRKCIKTLHLLLQIKPLSIPRHYLHGGELRNMNGLEIHGFSDASLKGCDAVVYLPAIMSDEIICNIAKRSFFSIFTIFSRIFGLKMLDLRSLGPTTYVFTI